MCQDASIFIVTEGDYSAKEIHSIWGSFEDACKAWASVGHSIKGVELHTLNGVTDPATRGLTFWKVCQDRAGHGIAVPAYDWDGDGYMHWEMSLERPTIVFVVLARDAEHAAKIVSDRCAQLIALGEWDRMEARLPQLPKAWPQISVAVTAEQALEVKDERTG